MNQIIYILCFTLPADFYNYSNNYKIMYINKQSRKASHVLGTDSVNNYLAYIKIFIQNSKNGLIIDVELFVHHL